VETTTLGERLRLAGIVAVTLVWFPAVAWLLAWTAAPWLYGRITG
jgi:hypothetical protein